MSTWIIIVLIGVVVVLAVNVGRCLDTQSQRRLWQEVAQERRLLAQERQERTENPRPEPNRNG
jgi:hypothetical protein